MGGLKMKYKKLELQNTAIKCENEEEFNHLMDIYTEYGWVWNSGEEPHSHKPPMHQELIIQYEDGFTRNLNHTNPITFKELLMMITPEHEFEFGELIEVRDCDLEEWLPRIFMGYIKQSIFPYLVCPFVNEENFKKGENVLVHKYKYARKIQQKPTTLNGKTALIDGVEYLLTVKQ